MTAWEMIEHNENPRNVELFTKQEFKLLKTNAMIIFNWNLNPRNELFTKNEILKIINCDEINYFNNSNNNSCLQFNNFTRAEFLTKNPNAGDMVFWNANPKNELFTKAEILEKSPTIYDMLAHNRNERNTELFTKAEIATKNPSAQEMNWHNENLRNIELFTVKEFMKKNKGASKGTYEYYWNKNPRNEKI